MLNADARAAAAMFLCALCWSASGLFIKQTDWHPMVISCFRSAVAAVFMAAVHGKAMFVNKPFVSKPLRAAVPRLLGMNALFFAAATSAATKITYITAAKMTSPVNAILLQHTAPVWAALAAGAFIGERLRPAQWAAVAMTGAGIVVFFFGSLQAGALAGDAVALLSGLCFAFSMIALRSLKDNSPARALFYSHLIPAALGLPFVFIAPPALSAANIARVLFLGVVQAGAASLLYAYAIKRLPAVNAMLIAQLEPVLNPVWLFIFSGERSAAYALAGGTMIIAAVVIAHKKGRGEVSPLPTAPHSGSSGTPLSGGRNHEADDSSTAPPATPPGSPRFFPLFVSVAGKHILIIGGGNIAARRLKTLLQFDCRVHIIAEKINGELEKTAAEHSGAVSVELRPFRAGDCAVLGVNGRLPFLVIAATDSRDVNSAAAKECAAHNIPVSVADCKEESTFYFPAVVIHDTIVAGISSGGKDHGAAREAAAKIRRILSGDTNRDT